MKISQKGFVIPIIIAIVAVIALGGGYYYTQKQSAINDKKISSIIDETANWKLYTNTQYGYQVKYPNNWKIYSMSSSSVNLISPETEKKLKDYPSLPVRFNTIISIIPYLSRISGSDSVSVYKNDLIFNGIKAEQVTIKDEEGVNKYIYIDKNGITYQITAATNDIEEKILSTFKFISTATPSCESKTDGQPIITSISTTSGPIGTILEIGGCNLSGFEGDLDVVFEKTNGQKIILADSFGSYIKTSDKLIKVEIKEPCQKGEKVVGRYSGIESVCDYIELTPGLYKVYVEPWGKKSNVVNFEIKSTLTQPSITIISPNGGEIIPYGQITMAGDLMFRWSTSEGDKYKPSTKITISIIDVNGIIVRDNEFNTISDIGNGIFVSSFIGENKIKSNTKYKIKICDFIAGKNICDSSDNYFLIK